VDVVAPEQMIGDDALRRMHNGHDAFEREPLVAL
jgi:hypothetical protein